MANLKKHIKKKYLFEKEATEEDLKHAHAIPWDDFKESKNINKNNPALIFYTNNKVVLSFPVKHQGKITFIPAPDPVLMYFHSAYLDLKQVEIKRKEIYLSLEKPDQEEIINELYEFFSSGSGVIINLFTTLESFINRAVPAKDFVYKKDVQQKWTQVYDKKQIERHLSFKEKLTSVLAQVYEGKKRPFQEAHPTIFDKLESLRQFRDDLIHLKSSGDENQVAYEKIYKKLLEYDYVSALNAVKDFCNYYHLNSRYIEECPCSNPD